MRVVHMSALIPRGPLRRAVWSRAAFALGACRRPRGGVCCWRLGAGHGGGALQSSLADLVDSVAEAVVNISATQTVEERAVAAPHAGSAKGHAV